jgi:hypothetical protein
MVCSYYCGVIAPEDAAGGKSQTGRGVLLGRNLLAVVAVFILLQVWRPCFFLTDDNLTGDYPFFMEMGNHLLHGQSPFISDHLFGGHYNYLRDAAAFSWHPLYLLVSLLAGTPFHFWMVDVDALAFILIGATGFVMLAWQVRREFALPLSDGWIIFYNLSFCYSVYALTIGASWLNFLGNQSALPWLALGILQKSWRNGIGLVFLFSLHHILGGHLSPLVSDSIFLSFFALGVSIWRRSARPLGCWLIGYALAVLVLSPLLATTLGGFFDSPRAGGVTEHDMGSNNIPAYLFPASLFLGMGMWILHPNLHLIATYTLAVNASCAAWCLPLALVSRARWRGLEVVTLAMMLFIGLLICRPVWVTDIMLQLPLFKAMRWPFREVLQFQFFLHLFLLLRQPTVTPRMQKLVALVGTFVVIIPMWFYVVPPTLNPMTWDRKVLLSGAFDPYWAKVRPLLNSSQEIGVLIPRNLYDYGEYAEPYALLGSYNYAIPARVVNIWGYSPTAPKDQFPVQTIPIYPFGAFQPEEKESLMRERPNLNFITLESTDPLKITLSSRDGPTIDLTPLVPPELRHP